MTKPRDLFRCLPLLAASTLAASGEVNFSFDSPTTVAANTYLPYRVVNAYAPAAVFSYGYNNAAPGALLGDGTVIRALAQRPSDGAWLVTFDAPTTISATTYHPGDVALYNGANYSKYRDRVIDFGLGEDVHITGYSIDAAGVELLALDAPATVALSGGGTFDADPRDILRFYPGTASFARMLRGSNFNIPAEARLTGFEPWGGTQYLISLDIPVTLGGVNYHPGDLLLANTSGNSVSLYYRDGAPFPLSPEPPAGMGDFSLPLSPGMVGNSLTVSKNGGNLDFKWSAPADCSAATAVRDYALYEGTLGNFYSHSTALSCSTGGATSQNIAPGGGSTYYLVVPNNGAFEGGYGTGASGAIPVSAAACRATQRALTCN